MLRYAVLVALLACSVTAIEDFVDGKVARRVVRLTNDNFKTAIKDPANPIWLISFTAYWCGHCKKLAPVLETAAPQVAGRMAIGKIDCTEDKKICEKYKIRGYPTLKFALDGDLFDYTLGRTEEDIVAFAERLSRPTVNLLESVDRVMKYTVEDTFGHGVSFLCHDPKAPEGSVEQMLKSSKLMQICSQAARKEMANAHFITLPGEADVSSITGEDEEVFTDENGITQKKPKAGGFVCRLEKNVPPRCLMEKETIIDTDSVVEFVRVNNVATVSELGPQNFHRIGRLGRPLVIGVADLNEDEHIEKMKSELANFAVKGASSLTSKYYFGWMDGVKWAKFLQQFDIKQEELPQIFVLDVPKRKYWRDPQYKDKPLKDFLTAIADGDIESKESGGVRGAQFLNRIAGGFVNWMPWSLFLLLGMIAAVVVAVVPDGKDLRPPHKGAGGGGSSQPVDTLLGKKDS